MLSLNMKDVAIEKLPFSSLWHTCMQLYMKLRGIIQHVKNGEDNLYFCSPSTS